MGLRFTRLWMRLPGYQVIGSQPIALLYLCCRTAMAAPGFGRGLHSSYPYSSVMVTTLPLLSPTWSTCIVGKGLWLYARRLTKLRNKYHCRQCPCASHSGARCLATGRNKPRAQKYAKTQIIEKQIKYSVTKSYGRISTRYPIIP